MPVRLIISETIVCQKGGCHPIVLVTVPVRVRSSFMFFYSWSIQSTYSVRLCDPRLTATATVRRLSQSSPRHGDPTLRTRCVHLAILGLSPETTGDQRSRPRAGEANAVPWLATAFPLLLLSPSSVPEHPMSSRLILGASSWPQASFGQFSKIHYAAPCLPSWAGWEASVHISLFLLSISLHTLLYRQDFWITTSAIGSLYQMQLYSSSNHNVNTWRMHV
jgi:hypothetical protein